MPGAKCHAVISETKSVRWRYEKCHLCVQQEHGAADLLFEGLTPCANFGQSLSIDVVAEYGRACKELREIPAIDSVNASLVDMHQPCMSPAYMLYRLFPCMSIVQVLSNITETLTPYAVLIPLSIIEENPVITTWSKIYSPNHISFVSVIILLLISP